MIRLAEGDDPDTGLHEFYFVGLDQWDAFDICIHMLSQISDVIVGDILDGFGWRVCEVAIKNAPAKLIFHEDVGVYLCPADRADDHVEDARRVAEQLVIWWNATSNDTMGRDKP